MKDQDEFRVGIQAGIQASIRAGTTEIVSCNTDNFLDIFLFIIVLVVMEPRDWFVSDRSA